MKKILWTLLAALFVPMSVCAAQTGNDASAAVGKAVAQQVAAKNVAAFIDVSTIPAQYRAHVINAVKKTVPGAERIVSLGQIYSAGEFYDMNGGETWKRDIYYIRTAEDGKINYYSARVVVWNGQLKFVDVHSLNSEGALYSSLQQTEAARRHVEKLGEQFAEVSGNETLSRYLLVFARHYPLTSIKGFRNYRVIKHTEEEASEGWQLIARNGVPNYFAPAVDIASVEVVLFSGAVKKIDFKVQYPNEQRGWARYFTRYEVEEISK